MTRPVSIVKHHLCADLVQIAVQARPSPGEAHEPDDALLQDSDYSRCSDTREAPGLYIHLGPRPRTHICEHAHARTRTSHQDLTSTAKG